MRVVLAVTHQGPVAVLVQAPVQPGFKLAKEGVVDGREDQADQVGLLGKELAGDCVGAVMELFHRLVDPLLGGFAQVATVVEDPGNRCFGDPG